MRRTSHCYILYCLKIVVLQVFNFRRIACFATSSVNDISMIRVICLISNFRVGKHLDQVLTDMVYPKDDRIKVLSTKICSVLDVKSHLSHQHALNQLETAVLDSTHTMHKRLRQDEV